MRLGFLSSHRGSNLQAILDACSSGLIDAEPVVVISNNSESQALQRARDAGVATAHLSNSTHPEPADLDSAILGILEEHRVDLVILAGYMRKLGPRTLARYENRVLNVHPGLLPKYGGKGMHGMAVHAANIENSESESGATVHIVNGEYDQGPVIAETRVKVMADDTPESLAARVLPEEHKLFVDVVRRAAKGEIPLGRDLNK